MSSITQLLEKRSQIDAELAMLTGGAAVGTTATGKKERKPSKNKGVPTAYGAFSSKVQAEHKDEITAHKAANPDKKRGAHFEWVGAYKKAHEEEYKAFEAAFKEAHPKVEGEAASEAGESETSSQKKRRGPKKLDEMTEEEKAAHKVKVAERKATRDAQTPEEKAAKKAVAAEKKATATAKKGGTAAADSVPAADSADSAVPAADSAVPVAKKTVKRATKAKAAEPIVPVATFSATTVPATVPAAEDDEPEFLPFKHGGLTYMRLGNKREGGNLWATGDLWANKKGVKGTYVGCLQDDGTIDDTAEEPTIE